MISRPCMLVAALLLLPGAAGAQSPDQSFADLRQHVGQGSRILVTDDTGKTMNARVADVSDSTLTALVGGETRLFTPDQLTRIRRRDSLGDGIAIGLAGGAAAGWGWVRSECGPPGFDRECSVNAGIVLIPLSAGIGAGIGALVDAMIQKTVFESHGQRSQLTLSPLIGKDVRGVRASIRF